MMSLKSISTVRSAIQSCLIPELKREILCASGSEFDKKKVSNQHERKRQWNEIVERKARELLTNQGLPGNLQNKVMAIVPAIGLRMLIWAEYHEGTLKLTREDSISFLKYTHFTLQGVIDNVKAARELVEDDQFSIEQKYVLACIYCFRDKVDYLFRQMTEKGIKPISIVNESTWIPVLEIVKFWTRRWMGVTYPYKKGTSLYESRIEIAIKSGSKEAVEHIWAMTNSRYRRYVVAYGAAEVIRIMESTQDDWIVFRNERYCGRYDSWVPNDYYIDILCFLLSKMTPEDLKGFLWSDCTGNFCPIYNFSERSRVLELFLRFPYQNHFMKTAAVMWDFLSGDTYAVLLLKICDKIDTQKEKNFYYREEKSYHYRSLLKEFWSQSPDCYKRYIFENHYVNYMTKTGSGFLMKLLSLKKFTLDDEDNLRLILTSASDQERESIFSSKEWRGNCLKFVKKEKWEVLRRFVFTCFSCKKEADKFKRELSFSEEAKIIFFDFLKQNRMNAAESFIEWIALPEQVINDLKREIIQSKHGIEECLKLLMTNSIKTLEKLISWCLPSDGEAIALKAKLVFELNMKRRRVDVTGKYVKELLDELSRSHSSTKNQGCEDYELKKSIAFTFGCTICEELISDYSLDFTFDEKSYDHIRTRIEFRGGKWENVDEFLTWCFSSTKEIDDFKKGKLLENSGVKILFSLIKSKQLAEAHKFVAWLGLTEKEETKLKNKTLFHHREAWMMFSELVFSKEMDELCSDSHNNDESKEILCWLLSDRKTVLKFRDAFKQEFGSFDKTGLKHFKEKIDRYLSKLEHKRYKLKSVKLAQRGISGNLPPNHSGVKRKAGTFPSNKKHCSLKQEVKEALNIQTRSMAKRQRDQELFNKEKII